MTSSRNLFHTIAVAVVSFALVCAANADLSDKYGAVDLLRDQWGTANVYSDTDAGAMYGLGYACAEDRFFQMCYYRLMMQGRVAEIFGDIKGKKGATAIEFDKEMRISGYARAADEVFGNLDADSRGLLEAYADGVNAYIADYKNDLHPLFEKYEITPEPWTAADCILSWWHLARFFAKDVLSDKIEGGAPSHGRSAGPRASGNVDDSAAVVLREDVSDEWVAELDAFTAKHMAQRKSGAADREGETPKFSHAWVVGGAKTTTGSSVLVSDPQTPVWNPSMLYEYHAAGKTFNTRGAGVPGSPIILIGYTDKVAWGMTALGADQADLFILKTDPKKPNQYQLDGKWTDFAVREETILVKDGKPQKITIKESCFGPVVDDLVRNLPEGKSVAVKRVPMCEPDRDSVQGAFAMMRAKDAQEFGEGLPGWRFPTANCIYGDTAGNIGYWTLGALPIRSPKSPSIGAEAHDGSSTEMDWQQMIPYKFLPHVLNPGRGYLVSANHRPIQSFYKLTFGNRTGNSGDTDRGLAIKERIWDHLSKNDKFTPEDVLAVQYDAANCTKRELVHLGYHIRDNAKGKLKENSLKALEYLEPWFAAGGQSNLEYPGAELVNEMSFYFRAGMHDVALEYGGGVSGQAMFAKKVKERLEKEPNAGVSNDELKFVDSTLSSAWGKAVAKYGADPSQWNLKAKQTTDNRTMGYYAGLDGFLSLDSRWDIQEPYLPVTDGSTIWSQRGQSYTQYVPMHDPDSAMAILPIGPSERPDSPFRFSTLGDWSKGTLHPAPLSRAAVEKIAVMRTALVEGQKAVASSHDGPEVMPGQKPSDPELVEMVGSLMRKTSSDAEIDEAAEAMRKYVYGDEDLTAQAISGLRVTLYVDYGTEHGQETMKKLIQEFGGELPPARPQKYIKALEEKKANKQATKEKAASSGGSRSGR